MLLFTHRSASEKAWPLWKAKLCKLPHGHVRPAASPTHLLGLVLGFRHRIRIILPRIFLICEELFKAFTGVQCTDELRRVRWERKSKMGEAECAGEQKEAGL